MIKRTSENFCKLFLFAAFFLIYHVGYASDLESLREVVIKNKVTISEGALTAGDVNAILDELVSNELLNSDYDAYEDFVPYTLDGLRLLVEDQSEHVVQKVPFDYVSAFFLNRLGSRLRSFYEQNTEIEEPDRRILLVYLDKLIHMVGVRLIAEKDPQSVSSLLTAFYGMLSHYLVIEGGPATFSRFRDQMFSLKVLHSSLTKESDLRLLAHIYGLFFWTPRK